MKKRPTRSSGFLRFDPDEKLWNRLMSREGLTDGELIASAKLWAGEPPIPAHRRRRAAAFIQSIRDRLTD